MSSFEDKSARQGSSWPSESTMSSRKENSLIRPLAILLGVSVFVVDMVTKVIVQRTPWLHHFPVVRDVLTIQYDTNEGIAFGLFHDVQSPWKAPILTLMAVLALGMVLYYLWSTPARERIMILALGLLLGGILGNFIDRLRNQAVVDFIKVHWGSDFVWPTFNVADAAITSGVLIILLITLIGGGEFDREKSPAVE